MIWDENPQGKEQSELWIFILLHNDKERGRKFPFMKYWRIYIYAYMDVFFNMKLEKVLDVSERKMKKKLFLYKDQ